MWTEVYIKIIMGEKLKREAPEMAKAKILLVEDDKLQARVTKDYLESVHKVKVCHPPA